MRLNKKGMKRMKKFFPAFLAFLLVFSTVGPLPGVAVTEDTEKVFPGSVNGSVVNENNTGTVTVKMNGGNTDWTITLRKLYGNKDQQGMVLDNSSVFTNVPAGLYIVRAEKDTNVIRESAPIMVKPKSLTVSSNSNGNIITTLQNPYNVKIENAFPSSTIKLYIKDAVDNPYRETTASANGNAVFGVSDAIDARSNYYLTQTINGAVSDDSELFTVYPSKLTIERMKNSGSSNNEGSILVKNIKAKSKIVLHSGGLPVGDEITPPTNQFTFKELPAGKYTVIQKENGVQSSPSNEIEIYNEQLPIINLNGDANLEIRYGINSNDIVSSVKYTEAGYKVTDKNKKVYEGKETAFFCESGSAVVLPCTPLKMKVEVTGDLINESNRTIPGKYTVTYKATDGEFDNLSKTIQRNVTVYPNKVNIYKEDTDYQTEIAFNQRKTGTITVKGVYGGANLKLYQRTTDGSTSEIQSKIDKVSDGEYKFSNVQVGQGYYVVQTVNNVESLSSTEIEIRDNTSPVLTLINDKEITLEVGDQYIEYGVTALDNIDTPEELAEKIVVTGKVNTEKPGTYKITYNVRDKAGNEAVLLERTIIINPRPVIAIGSTAITGEVGVKNIYPGTSNPNSSTTLKLFKLNEDGQTSTISGEIELNAEEKTYVFKNVVPGRYYVTQTVSKQESRQSNVIEIVDLDKPYITLNGPEKLSYVINQSKEPYYTEGSPLQFDDPGMVAKDYLEVNLENSTKIITPDGIESNCSPNSKCITSFSQPGLYKIRYSSIAPNRNSKADNKFRLITVAPKQTTKPEVAISNNIHILTATVDTYTTPTIAKLYNSYNQYIGTGTITGSTATFKDIPAGIGYYVTQTVNGIESQPSLPVNVNIFEDAKPTALITSFNFKEVDAISVIDQKAEKITVTVPKTANLESLTPIITSIGTVTPNPSVKTDFSDGKPKSYSVVNSAGNKSTTKTYSVTVKHAANSSVGSLPLEKDGVLTPLSPSVSLSPIEMDMAKEYGVTFITKDKKVEAHVPSSNVIESGHSTFTLKQSLAGESYEVSFGNLSRFMQPIELKLPKSGTKVLAKLVDGYTVAVPSATTSTSTIGLVDEPGTYALVDSVSAPRINPAATGSATYTLQLARLETAGTIYYTTSSKDISFTTSPQSTNAQLKNKYVATASPADILKWTKYTPNDKISTPTGELYAVVVNGNQISQITALEAAPAVDWSKNIPSYDTHKVLNINFNARVDREALYSGLIYVLDDATNEKVATTLQMSGDGKTIYVVPKKAYTRGKQYTLHIDRQFKGNTKNKEFLKKSLLQTFKIN
ncbi:hypothetical protein CSV67_14045 [Sporosarcina sp. P2]|uniref:DUF5011 domain-containing protein n=1 Tax=Sporosarcina sp. P2 TaxID=2048251 RepID=UPI000C165376|nr:DUF5011 domain-containing protein [Sporosarcina sp. P2]PID01466.1 hypothetical protein CSV67_14045 [Sporosarcina sp. P2]